jgi:hypothetical protein
MMNTKMYIKIYTGSGRQSIIPYVSWGCLFPLLVLVSSIDELVMGVITSFESAARSVCSSGCESVLVWLGPPL